MTVFCCRCFSHFIEQRRIFQRTNSQRRSKIVKLLFLCQFCSLCQTQCKTFFAALATLRNLLQSFYLCHKPLRFIGTFNKRHRIFHRKLPDQTFFFFHTFVIFCCLRNIRIIEKHCNVEIFRQILQYITTARCTASV